MTRTLRRFCVLLAVAALTPACSDKEEPGYTPPETAAQTHLMYMPWSGNLTSYFRTNIEDMARVVAEGIPADVRVLVYFMESPDEASLFELYRRGGRCERLTLRTYDPAPDFTAAEGIASVLGDVKREAPALRYSMSIGSHGMAWLPAVSSVPGRAAAPARREYWEHAAPDRPLTRWFGGTSPDHRTEIATLAEALARTGLHMEYILFDDCYMSSVEVAYELRGVTDYLIGSTSEIMAYGFPYASAGRHMLGEVDYEGICDAFHAFYSTYTYPYGTIGVTRCAGWRSSPTSCDASTPRTHSIPAGSATSSGSTATPRRSSSIWGTTCAASAPTTTPCSRSSRSNWMRPSPGTAIRRSTTRWPTASIRSGPSRASRPPIRAQIPKRRSTGSRPPGGAPRTEAAAPGCTTSGPSRRKGRSLS